MPVSLPFITPQPAATLAGPESAALGLSGDQSTIPADTSGNAFSDLLNNQAAGTRTGTGVISMVRAAVSNEPAAAGASATTPPTAGIVPLDALVAPTAGAQGKAAVLSESMIDVAAQAEAPVTGARSVSPAPGAQPTSVGRLVPNPDLTPVADSDLTVDAAATPATSAQAAGRNVSGTAVTGAREKTCGAPLGKSSDPSPALVAQVAAMGLPVAVVNFPPAPAAPTASEPEPATGEAAPAGGASGAPAGIAPRVTIASSSAPISGGNLQGAAFSLPAPRSDARGIGSSPTSAPVRQPMGPVVGQVVPTVGLPSADAGTDPVQRQAGSNESLPQAVTSVTPMVVGLTQSTRPTAPLPNLMAASKRTPAPAAANVPQAADGAPALATSTSGAQPAVATAALAGTTVPSPAGTIIPPGVTLIQTPTDTTGAAPNAQSQLGSIQNLSGDPDLVRSVARLLTSKGLAVDAPKTGPSTPSSPVAEAGVPVTSAKAVSAVAATRAPSTDAPGSVVAAGDSRATVQTSVPTPSPRPAPAIPAPAATPLSDVPQTAPQSVQPEVTVAMSGAAAGSQATAVVAEARPTPVRNSGTGGVVPASGSAGSAISSLPQAGYRQDGGGSGGESLKKDGQVIGEKGQKPGKTIDGIDGATSFDAMTPSRQPIHDTAHTVSPSPDLSSSQAVHSAPLQTAARALTGDTAGTVSRTLEVVRDVSEHIQARANQTVNFTVSFHTGEQLSVSLEYRGGVMHTTFNTDSPELRNAITRDWQSQMPTAADGDRSVKIAPPVFGDASPRNSLDQGGQQRQQQQAFQQQTAQNSQSMSRAFPGASSRRVSSNPVVGADSVPAPRQVVPDTSRHLHTFA
ncbi:hypothetical protein GALL_11170 [mine drainage metagenome]|uniref:Flagellar hook-length control protein FliK n=1 Tax=mine drainage metagenome TaxID=410659 RepID=A0A1J5TCZ2_9ZZZZ